MAGAELSAFPGAVGQGAAATGGRGGDVYYVTNLRDYNRQLGESEIPGSLRHAIESAKAPRTIVFDIGGSLKLSAPLDITNSRLTVAGQTAPGGVTLWGYPVNLDDCSDVIIRFLRVRTGDFNARSAGLRGAAAAKGNHDLDASSANAVDVGGGCQRIILDHVSSSWGMDETLSVTRARDITVQHSIIAESLNESFHPKGPHGYGSLIRGELTPEDQQAGKGGYTLYGNLWAHHMARNPSIAGQQRLERGQAESERRRADVNLVNNVVYDWGSQPTHRSNFGQARINIVGNYYVNGPAKASAYIFHENNAAPTLVYQEGNYRDGNRNGLHDGLPVDRPEEVRRAFRDFDASDRLVGPDSGRPFNFFATVADDAIPAEEAYARVVSSVGASLWRDAVDQRIVDSLIHGAGGIINSQEVFRDPQGNLPGIDDVPTVRRPANFDTDRDGMPDEFELAHGLDPSDPADRNGTDLSGDGYTNLEVYLQSVVDASLPE